MREFFAFSTSNTKRAVYILLVVVLVSMLSACGSDEKKKAPKPKVGVVEVLRKDVPIQMELVGQTIGSVDIAVRARVDGTLIGLHFEEGKTVDKGQLLYTIDSRPFEAKVVEAKGQLAEAQTALAKADSDLKRIKPLADMSAVSKRELDAAIAQEGAAKASVQAAEAAVEFAEIERSYTKIEASVDGLIGITKAKVGDYVGKEPNPVVLNMISQIDPIHVRVTISEQDYLRLARRVIKRDKESKAKVQKREEQVPLTLLLSDDSEHKHEGWMHAANSQIDPSTGTLTIEAAFPNPEELVRPGQYARIRTVVETQKDAILVPQRSVQELQGSFFVYSVNSKNIVKMRQVSLGTKSASMWVVKKGLKAGERVIVEGLQQVKAGVEVIPVSPKEFGGAEVEEAEKPAEPSQKKE